MNKARQVLQTCSPLQKIIKINDALGSGINKVSQKLYADDRNKCGRRCEDPSKPPHKPKVCGTCTQEAQRKRAQEAAEAQRVELSKTPGCLPFSNEPVLREKPCDAPGPGLKMCRKKPKVGKKKAGKCGPPSCKKQNDSFCD